MSTLTNTTTNTATENTENTKYHHPTARKSNSIHDLSLKMNRNSKKFRSLRAPHLILASSDWVICGDAHGFSVWSSQLPAPSLVQEPAHYGLSNGRRQAVEIIFSDKGKQPRCQRKPRCCKFGLGYSREDGRLGNTSKYIYIHFSLILLMNFVQK